MLKDKQIRELKEMCPKGTRIRLDHMKDPYHPVADGTLGTVDHVDDSGQIHMKWDNGGTLAVVPEEDNYEIIEGPYHCPKTIRVVIVEADKHPRIDFINNNLESMQSVVDGLIEEIDINDGAVLVCNEEGKLNNLKANRSVGDDIIAGTFFIAGDKGYEHLVSLSDEQIDLFIKQFYEIEQHTQEEMIDKIGYRFYGF